jgi:hypothetical protein
VIHYDPCVPVPYCDWAYAHDDLDGAPDANDNRYGYAATLAQAKAEIDEREFDACRCSAADPLECMALRCEHRDAGRAALEQGS